MNKKHGVVLVAVLALGWLTACSTGGAATPLAVPVATAGASTQAAPASPTPPPAPTVGQASTPPTPEVAATQVQVETPAPSASVCTVLTDLNLRTGPGTAYQPPLRVLPASTQVTPLAYSAVGYPAGAWIEVSLPGTDQRGWVSAEPEYVACDVDLTGLPPGANIPPTPTAIPTQPPQARAPEVRNSTIEGNIPDNLVGEVQFLPEAFIRMRVHDTDRGNSDGDGIDQVDFQVTDDNGNQVYQRTENNAAYCIFGGGEPSCNPWTLEDGVYKWRSGGKPVKPGHYTVNITVSPKNQDSSQGDWIVDLRLELP